MTHERRGTTVAHATRWLLGLSVLTAPVAGCGQDPTQPGDRPSESSLTLAIQTQPGEAASGLPLGVQPVVGLEIAGMGLATGDDSTVVTAEAGGGAGILEGTRSVTVSDGVARFTDLVVRGSVGEYVLVFRAGSLSATSDAFLLEPGAASPATSSVSVSAASVPVGETVDLTLRVRDAEGNGHTTGGLSIAFTVSGGSSQGTIGPVQDPGDGSYRSEFFATVPGTPSTIGATIEGVPVTSTLPTVQVVDDAPPTDSDAVPLIDMAGLTYRGLPGLLYSGSNEIPAAHSAVRPAVSTGGPFVLMSISMSNGRMEFCDPAAGSVGPQRCADYSFVGQAAADPDVNPDLVIVNAAQGGQPAEAWESPTQTAYDVADSQLGLFGMEPDDVEVIWLKQANPQPTVGLPDPDADASVLLRRLGNVVRAIKVRYPNVRQVYLSSRIWSCATGGLNPEPFAYESGFSVKWLIEAQIRQLGGGGIDPIAGDLGLDRAPWLAWGPYLWADDGNVRSDGLTWSPAELEADCTHPGIAARTKVGALLLEFFRESPLTAQWFLR